jgi:hypothetical protein
MVTESSVNASYTRDGLCVLKKVRWVCFSELVTSRQKLKGVGRRTEEQS